MTAADRPADRAAVCSALRARVARMERGAAADAGTLSLSDAIDEALPGGGLARGALHEVLAADAGAAAAFCALILARATGSVVWISATPDAWPPGLSTFGLDAADLVPVRAERPRDGLWAFEEALRSPAVAGALLTVPGAPPDMVAGRRLQLAAEAGGGVGLLLLADTEHTPPSPARTRWRVGAAAAEDMERPCWNLMLLRCSGGQPGAWPVMWERDTATLSPLHGSHLGRRHRMTAAHFLVLHAPGTGRDDDASYFVWPTDRTSYGWLTRLLPPGKMQIPKGMSQIGRDDLIGHAEGWVIAGIRPRPAGWEVCGAASGR